METVGKMLLLTMFVAGLGAGVYHLYTEGGPTVHVFPLARTTGSDVETSAAPRHDLEYYSRILGLSGTPPRSRIEPATGTVDTANAHERRLWKYTASVQGAGLHESVGTEAPHAMRAPQGSYAELKKRMLFWHAEYHRALAEGNIRRKDEAYGNYIRYKRALELKTRNP